jgi:hypothetical protein
MPVFIDFSAFPDPATRLGFNKRVTVDINRLLFEIKAADGTPLTRDTNIIFYTEATPLYTTVDYILLQGGEVLEALPDAAIYLEAYASSSFVDDILLYDPGVKFPDKTSQNYIMFRRARQEFATCYAIRNMLRAVLGSRGLSAGRRTLADFTIDLSGQANLISQARSFANDMADQCRFWLNAIYSGGAADFESPGAQSGVKSGTNSNEQAGIGRGWITGGNALNRRENSVISNGTKTRPRRYSSSGRRRF